MPNIKLINGTLTYGKPLEVNEESYKYKYFLDIMGPSYRLTLDKDADQTELWEKAYNMNVSYGIGKYTIENKHQYIMPYFEDNDCITSDFKGTCIGMQIPDSLIIPFLNDYMKDGNVKIRVSNTGNYLTNKIKDDDATSIRDLKEDYQINGRFKSYKKQH